MNIGAPELFCFLTFCPSLVLLVIPIFFIEWVKKKTNVKQKWIAYVLALIFELVILGIPVAAFGIYRIVN